ncbi:MAG: DUF4301 family protein [Bacteroidaceae bacterium]|nr:DUF4301 family protein [Bacteroidaceae bacterium]MBQ9191552.1 DUF4301 family protein [Bacteroidaceae bacterium]
MFTPEDRKQLSQKGISEQQIENQLRQFREGFPYLHLRAAASIGNGILSPSDSESQAFVEAWEMYKAEGHHITKFVPASGAASRMFKNLFEFRDGEQDAPQSDFMRTFFERLHDFAFFPALDDACVVIYGEPADALVEAGRFRDVVSALLDDEGLGYGQLPKGLLQFHAYKDCARTPLEEHLVEAALYATSDGKADVHFTVSTEHRELFEELVERVLPEYEKLFGVHYHISFSEQKPSTDTLAATLDNEPFRTDDGRLLFRPGGHGALIQNLSELESDIIFIKNIDNVVPDRLKPATTLWKKVIAGVLVTLQRQAFSYLRRLDEGNVGRAELDEMCQFLRRELCTEVPGISELSEAELIETLRRKFNRPMRVCGMVRNVGEPGGGPFLAFNPDGSVSPQILESSQIDTHNPTYMAMFQGGTHFNPVDLVCATRDYQGNHFDLPRYVDPATGFISSKSKNGRELKALELPGLWNGAMSDWSTIFVEVPLETFNPVKTVNDLLRPQHQA